VHMKQIVMLDGVQVAKDAFLQAEDIYYAQVLCDDGDDGDDDYELYYDNVISISTTMHISSSP
jgi:hypothetical protein